MAKNEKTSTALASLASRALKDPGSVTKGEITRLAGSVLTQAADKPKPKPKAKR
jgi:carnitine O-acetyltransferase